MAHHVPQQSLELALSGASGRTVRGLRLTRRIDPSPPPGVRIPREDQP
jgi:hypothetical protein